MDMQLSVNKLKQQRDSRAWTQSHLAEVSGVSLRTIQRVEKSGVASQESAQSICSAYGIIAEELLDEDNEASIKIKKPSKYNAKFLIPAIVTLGLSFSFKFNSTGATWLWEKEPSFGVALGCISIGLFVLLFYKSSQSKNV